MEDKEAPIELIIYNSVSISKGTSLIGESKINELINVNILGKCIRSHEDAAAIFSLFRDPRCEIGNIILTSDKGETLAHRAYTNGVPGAVVRYPKEILDWLTKEVELFSPKEAWISHNHPSGNPEPSFEDIANGKKSYDLFNKLNINLSGDLVLGDESYSVIKSNGQHFQKELCSEHKLYNKELLKQESLDQASLSEAFKDILTQNDNINIIAILNGDNKLISWDYIDNEKEIEPIYNYLRESGGDCAVIISNNKNNFTYYENLAKENINSERDIFYNIIKIDRNTGTIQDSFFNKINNWSLKAALNNPTMHLINRDIL